MELISYQMDYFVKKTFKNTINEVNKERIERKFKWFFINIYNGSNKVIFKQKFTEQRISNMST